MPTDDPAARLLKALPQGSQEVDSEQTRSSVTSAPPARGPDEGLTEEELARVGELRESIETLRGKQSEREERRDELKELFDKRIEDLKAEIDEKQETAEEKMAELEVLRCPPIQEPPPPGPECLNWVMSDYFNLVATIVIVSNIATMIMELMDKEKEKTFFWLDQSFMVFYVMEITCKAILMEKTLLVGKPGVVWWNWLDSIIVLSGVVDMWLQPILIMIGVMSGGHSLKILSFLRMLRLLRILKIVGMFMKADLSWSQGATFQLFIMSVIGFNSVLMGLESDIPEFWGWYWVEQVLLVIFSFEVACRLKFWGCEYFYHKDDIAWNLLDFIIVFGGIVDQWMMPTIALVKSLFGIKSGGSGNMGQVMMMLRMARLLRILRLVRLVKNIPPLFLLVVGIMQAMQGMMWVVVLTGVLLYAFSLLGVKLIGHGLVFGGAPPDDIAAVFPSIFESMFVLFKAMNGDWAALEPLFHVMPFSKVIFFCYTVISTWGILSILTAVVSENMINATEEHRSEVEAEEAERDTQEKEEALEKLFADVDEDNSGILTKSEFENMINEPDKAQELREASSLPENELKTLFQYLSKVEREDDTEAAHGAPGDELTASQKAKGEEPTVSRQDFIEGLKSEGRNVSERSVMRLERRIKALEGSIRLLCKAMPHYQQSRSNLGKDVMEFIDAAPESSEEEDNNDMG